MFDGIVLYGEDVIMWFDQALIKWLQTWPGEDVRSKG
jgi:hypothetical protein